MSGGLFLNGSTIVLDVLTVSITLVATSGMKERQEAEGERLNGVLLLLTRCLSAPFSLPHCQMHYLKTLSHFFCAHPLSSSPPPPLSDCVPPISLSFNSLFYSLSHFLSFSSLSLSLSSAVMWFSVEWAVSPLSKLLPLNHYGPWN